MGGGYFTGNFERNRILFFRDKLDCWRMREVCERRLWKRATLSFWVSLGNWKEGFFTGFFGRQKKVCDNGAPETMVSLRGELGGTAPLMGP
jgi:hypothetical protein